MVLLKRILSLLVLVIFILAIWTIHRTLAHFHYHEIIAYARAIPGKNFILAIILTAASYLVMTGYDQLAVKYLRTPLERWRIMLASFISYSFSNNIGLSVLTAGSLRYRLYSSWGLSAEQITKLVGFTMVTLWLGLFGAGGSILTIYPPGLQGISWLPAYAAHWIGPLFLMLVTGYVVCFSFSRQSFHLRSWEFAVPQFSLRLSQVLIGTLDWCLAGYVLYLLLPEQLSLLPGQLLSIYLFAQVIALISHVPGGLGVFESTILLVTPQTSSAALLGSLLLYRAIYYLLPLALATSLLVGAELLQRKKAISRISRTLGTWGSIVTPQLLALTTLIAGAILLFSGATPAARQRLLWLSEFMPLQLVELSHFLGSMAGALLLLLARGIQRRLDAAYLLTIILLLVGSLLSLIKGVDYEEASLLVLMAAALLPCRKYFYRKSSLFAESFTFDWAITVTVIFCCSIFLGLFSYKNIAYRQELWWHFALHADAPRFMRAAVGAGVLLLLFAIAKLLRPAPPRPKDPDAATLQKAKMIIDKSPSTEANLALLGDKALFFDDREEGFIMYGTQGDSWIVMGDPVAPFDVARDLIWQFRDLVETNGGYPVFYEVGRKMLPLYLDMGLSLYKLGEEAKVPLQEFSLEGSKRKGLRYTVSKLERTGCRFEIVEPAGIPEIMSRLKFISDTWLKEKNSREKGFSLGFFNPDYLQNFPVAIVRRNEEIIAFANIWQGADKHELSIDLMRYLPEKTNSIMEYLFIQLIVWGKEQGYEFFNLGMAPLAGLENRPFAPVWHRIGALLFRHGEHFYNFEGLRHYKEKFSPVWEPRYLACPGGLILPRLLTNTATLISGGIRGIFGK